MARNVDGKAEDVDESLPRELARNVVGKAAELDESLVRELRDEMARNVDGKAGEVDESLARRVGFTLWSMIGDINDDLGTTEDYKTFHQLFHTHQPPTYSDTSAPVLVDSWIREMEKLFIATRCPQDQMVYIASFYLEGRADTMYWLWLGVRDFVLVEPGFGWVEFKQRLMLNFYPSELRRLKEEEFLNLKQGSMTVQEYATKFEELARFEPCPDPNECLRVFRFVVSLNPKVGCLLVSTPSKTYQESYERAVRSYELVKANEAEVAARIRGVKRAYDDTTSDVTKTSAKRIRGNARKVGQCSQSLNSGASTVRNGEENAEFMDCVDHQLKALLLTAAQQMNRYHRKELRSVFYWFNRHHPPTYEGVYDAVVVDGWVGEIEKRFEATQCPEDQRVDIATYYLKGNADNWWVVVKDALSAQPGFGWVQFKEALRRRFYPADQLDTVAQGKGL